MSDEMKESAMTAAAGWFQHLPVMYILVGASLAFMAISLGVLGFRILLFSINPEHKLKFVLPKVSRGTNLVQIAFELSNDANRVNMTSPNAMLAAQPTRQV